MNSRSSVDPTADSSDSMDSVDSKVLLYSKHSVGFVGSMDANPWIPCIPSNSLCRFVMLVSGRFRVVLFFGKMWVWKIEDDY